MEALIALIGTATAVITVAITNYYSKKNQLQLEERKLKEEYYLSFLEALSKSAILKTNNIRDNFSDAQNRLLLIASPLVVEKLMIFHKYIMPSNIHLHPQLERHDELLRDLLLAMRADLFQNKKVNKNYPEIYLTGQPRKD
jgi:hypothetical protein